MRIEILALIILLGTPRHAFAIPITSPGDLDPGDTVIDFENLSSGSTTNPLTIAGATFSSPTILEITDISSFPASGDGQGPTGHAIVQGKTLTTFPIPGTPPRDHRAITITFADPVSEVALGYFDPSFANNRMQVFNASNQLLEELVIPTNAVTSSFCNLNIGGVSACFLGVTRSANEIAKVVLLPSLPTDVYSIDHITFGASVPEPSPGLLLGSGIVLLGLRRVSPRRRTAMQLPRHHPAFNRG